MFAATSKRRFPAALAVAASVSLAASLAASSSAYADPEPEALPDAFTRPACYGVAYREGRMIAWARWEQKYSLAKMRQVGFAEGTPAWAMQLVNAWVEDAYVWKATDEQIARWAKELGDTSFLPRADKLSVHETIAIWMRRLAMDCDAHADGQQTRAGQAVVAQDESLRVPAP